MGKATMTIWRKERAQALRRRTAGAAAPPLAWQAPPRTARRAERRPVRHLRSARPRAARLEAGGAALAVTL